MKILRIDSTSDVLTDQASEMRMNQVYPQFLLSGFTLVPALHAPMVASRDAVVQFTQAPDLVFITGVGHGEPTRFRGDYDYIFEKGMYNASEIRNKVVHFLSCATASELGHDFVANGCRAFIGYATFFNFEPEWAGVFFRCDARIDLALATGKTVAEAIADAKQQFDLEISHPSNAAIASELRARSDSLIGIGPDLNITIRSGS